MILKGFRLLDARCLIKQNGTAAGGRPILPRKMQTNEETYGTVRFIVT